MDTNELDSVYAVHAVQLLLLLDEFAAVVRYSLLPMEVKSEKASLPAI